MSDQHPTYLPTIFTGQSTSGTRVGVDLTQVVAYRAIGDDRVDVWLSGNKHPFVIEGEGISLRFESAWRAAHQPRMRGVA